MHFVQNQSEKGQRKKGNGGIDGKVRSANCLRMALFFWMWVQHHYLLCPQVDDILVAA